MKNAYYTAAIDLGASSGRILLGEYNGKSLKFVDEYRMENGFINVRGNYYWDFLGLYQNIVRGFRYFKNKGWRIDSVGINTWGVDTVLLDKNGENLGYPRCYRDNRNNAAYEKVSEIITPEAFYEETGILPKAINTVYQLYAASKNPAWDEVRSVLFVPDYFSYLITGEAVTETSIASTSQMLNHETGEFDKEIIEKLGLGSVQFPTIMKAPGIRGKFTKLFEQQTGYKDVKVMNINSHDTGSAVSFAEALGEDEILMNSGTIAIISSIRKKAATGKDAYCNGITNERMIDGKVRPAIWGSGMFFINQCKKWWEMEGKTYSWSDITNMAAAASDFTSRVNITAPELQSGEDMPGMMRRFCKKNEMRIPSTDGEMAFMIYASMAELFTQWIEKYEETVGIKSNKLTIVGGGAKNKFLNQLIADRSGREVRTGEAESTALGNMLTQLEGSGELSHEDTLEFMRSTFSQKVTKPRS